MCLLYNTITGLKVKTICGKQPAYKLLDFLLNGIFNGTNDMKNYSIMFLPFSKKYIRQIKNYILFQKCK